MFIKKKLNINFMSPLNTKLTYSLFLTSTPKL